MEFIREYLELSAKLSENDWRVFSSKLLRMEYAKKSTVLEIGQTEHYLSFVETGIIRYYIPGGEKNDHTIAFAFGHSFSSAYQSFLTRRPSRYQVETLTKTILTQVHFLKELVELSLKKKIKYRP